MPSPFPGFDPYIESQLNWKEFHTDFLIELKRSIMGTLPIGFVAESEVSISITKPGEPRRKSNELETDHRVGDITIFRTEETDSQMNALAMSVFGNKEVGIALPETVPSLRPQRFVKVMDTRGEKPEVIAVIELLSPTNKSGHGHKEYQQKQAQLLNADIHFMEIDLLRGGLYSVFVGEDELRERGAWDYVVTLRNLFTPNELAFWRIGLRDSLPTVYLPLTADVAPVPIKLQAVFAHCYDANFIPRRVDYAKPLKVPPFTENDAAWANDILKAAGLKPH